MGEFVVVVGDVQGDGVDLVCGNRVDYLIQQNKNNQPYHPTLLPLSHNSLHRCYHHRIPSNESEIGLILVLIVIKLQSIKVGVYEIISLQLPYDWLPIAEAKALIGGVRRLLWM